MFYNISGSCWYICHKSHTPLLPPVSSCHHLSSFGRPPSLYLKWWRHLWTDPYSETSNQSRLKIKKREREDNTNGPGSGKHRWKSAKDESRAKKQQFHCFGKLWLEVASVLRAVAAIRGSCRCQHTCIQLVTKNRTISTKHFSFWGKYYTYRSTFCSSNSLPDI